MTTLVQGAAVILWKLDVAFPTGGAAMEQIVLRWVHIFAGIAWVGAIYYTAVVVMPGMMKLDPTMRGKVMLVLMPRAAWVGRFGAFVTWLAGFRYFMIYAQTDAANAGDPSLAWRWIGLWFACWVVAFAIFMGALQSGKLPGAVLGLLAAIVAVAAQVQRMLGQVIVIGCWLTIPLLFLMEASSHFPFLSGK
jgi:uncharacterized membrane protein